MRLARDSDVEDEDCPAWELDIKRCYQRRLIENPQRDERFVANLRIRHPTMHQRDVNREMEPVIDYRARRMVDLGQFSSRSAVAGAVQSSPCHRGQ